MKSEKQDPAEEFIAALEKMREMDRRTLLRLLAASGMAGLTACSKLEKVKQSPPLCVPPGQSLARFPEKDELILLTDRPPQLETPLHFFRQDLTPNSAFFVRWHYAGIPTSVDLTSFSLSVSGHVENELCMTIDELRKDFEQVELAAVLQCSGNSRRFFQPMVLGGQWQNGAVGNARWTGVRLKDILKKAGVKAGALTVSFSGLDEAPLSNMPKFAKSLDIDHALSDELIVAYKMNGADLPMLNGFPLRLIVPGWYATYWVKALNNIKVLDSKFEGFWMDKAYRIPKNEFAEEHPEQLAKDTVPINRMNVRSLFVRPDISDLVKSGMPFDLEGLAFDGGAGIKKVEVSINNNWNEAQIEKNDLGKFSWCRWKFRWVPAAPGVYRVSVRATSANGQIQTETQHWNKSGYMRNVIESKEIVVV